MEGFPEGAKLVERAPKHPDIHFIVVRTIIDHFGGQVVRSADIGLGEFMGPELSGNAKIANFDESILHTEHIVRLEVPVDHILPMDVLESERDLSQDVENLLLRERTPLRLFLFDFHLEVPSIREFQEECQVIVLYSGLVELDDVGVLESVE